MTCQSSISDVTTLKDFTLLYNFAIQQNEAIYILGLQTSICNLNSNGLALSINLGQQSNDTFRHGNSISFNNMTALETFTQYIVAATGNVIAFVPTDGIVVGCNGPQNVRVNMVPSSVSLIHMFRQSQQPVPGMYMEASVCVCVKMFVCLFLLVLSRNK